MGDPLFVEVDRSGVVESSHLVDVAVAGRDGRLTASAGDPAAIAYLRSSAKPIQTLTCLESGWEAPGSEQIAVACGSHNGEPRHVEAARLTLAEAGVEETALRCPAAWPFLPETVAKAERAAPIFHNCSGKHAAMLAVSKRNGWSLEDYRSREHPLQRAVSDVLGRLAGRPARHVGVDGCGVPTFAFTLAESAGVFARLADEGRDVLDAMAAHPFLVAGTSRLCTAVIGSIPGIVIKVGAEGIACGVLRHEGAGFALKARDGSPRSRDLATIAVLRMLGALPASIPEALAPHVDPEVTGGGERVGAVRWRGELEGR